MAPLGFSGLLFRDLARLPIAGFSGRPQERRSILIPAQLSLQSEEDDIQNEVQQQYYQARADSKTRCSNNIVKRELILKISFKARGRYLITQRAFMVTVLEYTEVLLLLVSLCHESMQAFRQPLKESSCIFNKAVVGAPCSCSHQPVSLVITGAAGRRFTLSLKIQFSRFKQPNPDSLQSSYCCVACAGFQTS